MAEHSVQSVKLFHTVGTMRCRDPRSQRVQHHMSACHMRANRRIRCKSSVTVKTRKFALHNVNLNRTGNLNLTIRDMRLVFPYHVGPLRWGLLDPKKPSRELRFEIWPCNAYIIALPPYDITITFDQRHPRVRHCHV